MKTTFKDCLKEAIEKELPEEEGKSLSDKIRKSIGLDDVNKALNDPSKVERFQVLSPVKNSGMGNGKCLDDAGRISFYDDGTGYIEK